MKNIVELPQPLFCSSFEYECTHIENTAFHFNILVYSAISTHILPLECRPFLLLSTTYHNVKNCTHTPSKEALWLP